MIKKIPGRSISKLTIIFLSSILIPGFILAYFSIQTIANQKELIEKRLIEDQAEIAREIADNFQQQIIIITSNFFVQAESLYAHSQNEFASLNSLPYVYQSFIVNRQGEFRYPYYLQNPPVSQKQTRSPKFLEIIARAEKAEFAEANLPKAMQFYRQARSLAQNRIEAATAINGMARVFVKLGNNGQALKYYKILAEFYGSTIDNTGFPFAYYSIHQMVQIAATGKMAQVSAGIELILSQILNGKIPLAENTEVLLQEILTWLGRQHDSRSPDTQRLSRQIKSIQKLVDFVSQEGNSITEKIAGNNDLATLQTIGRYRVIPGSRDNQPVLYFVASIPGEPGFIGFKIDLDTLKQQLLETDLQHHVSFPITVDIISRDQLSQVESHPFQTIAELSPLVPQWRICIHPRNSSVVNKLILKRRWIYGIALAFLIAGMFLGIVLVLRDVSREKRLALLRSDFVSNVSHELKTPLTSIRMFAETMLLGRLQQKSAQQEYLSIIVNESARLTRLINTVLDFSKIEKGKKQYYFKRVDLSQVIESAIKAMKYFIRENGFKLTTEIDPNIEAVADADAIEQAALNLLSNAVKYSPDNKEIAVRLWVENEFIYFQVSDRGMGIPEAKQQYIFDKFYRAHSGHEKDTGGAGMGLTVVKHIVAAHQGKIELESTAGKGSSFTIILPRAGEMKK